MSSTPRPSYAERERERLRRFELKRSRSRSKVPGRGRGRPRLSDAELTKRCQQAQHVRRAREARQEQQRQAALPHGDAAWQARYQAAHTIAAKAAPRPSCCSPKARDLLLTLADVLLENFKTCPLALRSDRVVVGAYAAHADRERFRAATRCDGLTLDGVRCRLTSAHQGPNAAPLRCGGTRCVHHQPDKFTGTQCAGYTTRGRRCRVFSASGYEEAKPLRLGLPLCRWHTTQWMRAVYCAGVRKDGSPCGTASWHSHPGAQPLRDGRVFCAKHALPADEHCASCGATEGALRHDPQTPLPGLVPASHPRTTSRWYCEPCWSVYEASSDDDAECSEQCVPCASPSER